MIFAYFEYLGYKSRFYGVMVSTLDFESSDPSSNLGGTSPQIFLKGIQAFFLSGCLGFSKIAKNPVL